jgi:hypothetical protein
VLFVVSETQLFLIIQSKNMKDFLFLYRANWDGMPKVSAEEMQARTQKWVDWIEGIAAKGKLTSGGHRLHNHGKMVKTNHITDGPFVESKESVGGYSIIKANTYDEAVELARGCPILAGGGTVEVREIYPM